MSGCNGRPLTPEQIAAVRDDNIDFGDTPELDGEFWERAVLVHPGDPVGAMLNPRIWVNWSARAWTRLAGS